MYMYGSVGIIGGDKRQLYCAKAFADDGMMVTLGGFDKLKSECDMKITSVYEAAVKSDFVVLSLPCVKAGRLNAPFSEKPIMLTDDLVAVLKNKKIFCGMKDSLLKELPVLDSTLVFDYSTREEFAIQNAVSTAEGALEIAMREYEGTIAHSKILVCGYGRIGKVLSRMLCSMNADVTVSARKKSDLCWIETSLCNSIETSQLHTLSQFDIVFNTIPTMVLDSKVLSRVAKNAIVIDLASYPGGVDFEACSRLGICSIHALSLPGKAAPKTAGETIKNTITNIIEEDKGCRKLA